MKLATLCYIRRNGQTLMMLRNKKPNDMHKGKWSGLGGKLEQGESPEDCARREILEESGLTVTDLSLRGVLTFPKFKDDEDWYAFLYVITGFSGTLAECPEGELHWIDDAALSQLTLWEGDHLFLSWLNQPRFFSAKFVYANKRLQHHDVTFY